MRRLNIPTLASAIAARGHISAEDVDVLRQNVLNGEELWPHGARSTMLRRDQANWGRLELALVVSIMEKAGSAPVSLQHFLLEMTQQVRMGGTPWIFAPQQDVAIDAGMAEAPVPFPSGAEAGQVDTAATSHLARPASGTRAA